MVVVNQVKKDLNRGYGNPINRVFISPVKVNAVEQ